MTPSTRAKAINAAIVSFKTFNTTVFHPTMEENSEMGLPFSSFFRNSNSNTVELAMVIHSARRTRRTYEQRFQVANSFYKVLVQFGVLLQKVYIKPENFLIWCVINKPRLNNTARNKFVRGAVTRDKD
jgi:hypothetical protein